jgi:DNA-directed RNA polymerase specialized sigma24 family protein
MNCHSCPHYEDVMRGVYRTNPWLESPCAKCKLNEIAVHAVPYDDEHPPAGALSFPDDCTDESTLLPTDVLTQFVQGFLSLPPEQRDVVSLRYQGLQYKEIAERQGVTVSCVEKRHRLAMRDWPALESLFPYKVACHRYRRSRK